MMTTAREFLESIISQARELQQLTDTQLEFVKDQLKSADYAISDALDDAKEAE